MTEQEQIEEMAKVLCDDCGDNTVFGKLCKTSKGSYICECEKRKATALVQAGYGDIKQAQIDTINTIVKYCENLSHWCELKDCRLFNNKSDDLRNFLNRIFEEVEDEN